MVPIHGPLVKKQCTMPNTSLTVAKCQCLFMTCPDFSQNQEALMSLKLREAESTMEIAEMKQEIAGLKNKVSVFTMKDSG